MERSAKVVPASKTGRGDALGRNDGASDQHHLSRKEIRKKKIVEFLERAWVQGLMGFCLLLALFLYDIVTVLGIPNSWDDAIYSIMAVVLVLFLLELGLNSYARSQYVGSFFFWMDLFGALSLLVDIPWIFGGVWLALEKLFDDSGSGSGSSSGEILRVSRVSRIGARTGSLMKVLRVMRLVRLVRLHRYLGNFRGLLCYLLGKPNPLSLKEDGKSVGYENTSRIAERFRDLIARRVAALVMISVFVGPLLMYDLADRSKEMGIVQLNSAAADYQKDYVTTWQTKAGSQGIGMLPPLPSAEEAKAALDFFAYRFLQFFQEDELDVPMRVRFILMEFGGLEIEWDWTTDQESKLMKQFNATQVQVPRRESFVLLIESNDAGVSSMAEFNTEFTSRKSSWFNILLVIFIVLLLLDFSGTLAAQCKELMVDPLERMFETLRINTSALLIETAKGSGNETEVLENAIRKLAKVATAAQDDAAKVDVKAFTEDESLDENVREWLKQNFTLTNQPDIRGSSAAIGQGKVKDNVLSRGVKSIRELTKWNQDSNKIESRDQSTIGKRRETITAGLSKFGSLKRIRLGSSPEEKENETTESKQPSEEEDVHAKEKRQSIEMQQQSDTEPVMKLHGSQSQLIQTSEQVNGQEVEKAIYESYVERLLDAIPFDRKSLDDWNHDVLLYSTDELVAQAAYAISTMAYLLGTPLHLNRVTSFCNEMKRNYQVRDNPYHTFHHGVDVMLFVFNVFRKSDAMNLLYGEELFGLVLAALGHDVGHMGVNNNFLIETGDSLAVRYNDVSPLENMHAAILFETLGNPSCNLLEDYSIEAWKMTRKIMIEAILSTDMVKHFKMLTQIKIAVEMYPQENSDGTKSVPIFIEGPENETRMSYLHADDKRMLLAKVIMHCGDLGNPVKPPEISDKWVTKVMEEFFLQGDRERKLGLAISSLCDRNNVIVEQAQFNFIHFIVGPLYTNVLSLFPCISILCEQLVDNQSSWLEKYSVIPTAENETLNKMKQQHQHLRDGVFTLIKEFNQYRSQGPARKETHRRSSINT